MATIISRLAQYTTCDVADALLKLKHPSGGFLADLVPYSPLGQGDSKADQIKIVGEAYTVKMVPLTDEKAPKVNSHYIDGELKNKILFLSAPPNIVNAVYGGLMSRRAKYLGAAGTVIDGRLRDLQEHRELDFTVFARGTGTTAPAEVCRPSQINVPVRLNSDLQNVWIKPGDFIIADVNGVVCLPKDLAEQALELIPPQLEADALIAKDIDAGVSAEYSFKERRKHLK